MPGMGTTVGLIKSLAKINPEDVKSSVEDWLDDHPEATTTVQDGSITREKLHSDLQDVVDEVDEHSDEIGELKNEIDGNPESGSTITVSGLNFAENATKYTSSGAYGTFYIAVQKGQDLFYELENT